MTFYQRLEPLLQNMSQKALADLAGVKPSSVFEWEKNGTVPRAVTVIKIAEHFDVSVKWLVTGKDETGITLEGYKLLGIFNQLDSGGQKELIQIAELKLNNQLEDAKKGDISSNSERA